MKNCLSVVIISCVWDVVFILCFCGASGGLTLLTLAFPCINGVTKLTQHHMHGYGHPNFDLVVLCALTLGMLTLSQAQAHVRINLDLVG
jgi:hypothetical protein